MAFLTAFVLNFTKLWSNEGNGRGKAALPWDWTQTTCLQSKLLTAQPHLRAIRPGVYERYSQYVTTTPHRSQTYLTSNIITSIWHAHAYTFFQHEHTRSHAMQGTLGGNNEGIKKVTRYQTTIYHSTLAFVASCLMSHFIWKGESNLKSLTNINNDMINNKTVPKLGCVSSDTEKLQTFIILCKQTNTDVYKYMCVQVRVYVYAFLSIEYIELVLSFSTRPAILEVEG